MEVRFVSSNAAKFREVRAILAPFGITTRWARRTLPEPQAEDLLTVARAKTRALPSAGGPWIVEDSGLFIEPLGGFPGVYSAYAYRTLGIARIARLVGVGPRRAVFRTVAGVRTGRSTWFATGETRGTIAARPRGHDGFGYDPIFVPDGASRTFAQLPPEEKNRLSHRGRAFRAVGRRLVRGGGLRPARSRVTKVD
jgi:XTP/dITP diphosphohydrolase